MHKFQRGDKVIVLDGRSIENYAFNWVPASMDKYIGKVVTVAEYIRDRRNSQDGYLIEEEYLKFDERGLKFAIEGIPCTVSNGGLFDLYGV